MVASDKVARTRTRTRTRTTVVSSDNSKDDNGNDDESKKSSTEDNSVSIVKESNESNFENNYDINDFKKEETGI